MFSCCPLAPQSHSSLMLFLDPPSLHRSPGCRPTSLSCFPFKTYLFGAPFYEGTTCSQQAPLSKVVSDIKHTFKLSKFDCVPSRTKINIFSYNLDTKDKPTISPGTHLNRVIQSNAEEKMLLNYIHTNHS